MKFKRLITMILLVSMCLTVSACSKGKADVKEGNDSGVQTIKIGTCDKDLEDMVLSVKDEFLKEGYKIEIKMFAGEVVAPNIAVSEGTLDANFYQHVPYMVEFNKNKGTNLVAIGESIFYSNMGLYSEKITKIDEVKEGMKIAISSDATNRTRALLLMQDLGLVKLKAGLEVYSKLDVEENKYNLEITELDTAMIPSSLPDVDMVIIYPYDMELAGYEMKPLAMDPSKIGRKYGISLVTDKKNEDAKWAKILSKLLQGEKTKKVVEEYYKDTGVHISDY
ncbi:MAG: MetQ/NlpA family ABC transporter substrate-binding protein [Clostridium sp.]